MPGKRRRPSISNANTNTNEPVNTVPNRLSNPFLNRTRKVLRRCVEFVRGVCVKREEEPPSVPFAPVFYGGPSFPGRPIFDPRNPYTSHERNAAAFAARAAAAAAAAETPQERQARETREQFERMWREDAARLAAEERMAHYYRSLGIDPPGTRPRAAAAAAASPAPGSGAGPRFASRPWERDNSSSEEEEEEPERVGAAAAEPPPPPRVPPPPPPRAAAAAPPPPPRVPPPPPPPPPSAAAAASASRRFPVPPGIAQHEIEALNRCQQILDDLGWLTGDGKLIRKMSRKGLLKFHPNKGGNEERFKEIQSCIDFVVEKVGEVSTGGRRLTKRRKGRTTRRR